MKIKSMISFQTIYEVRALPAEEEDIEKTQNFLIKEYNLIGSSKIEFEYKNIYDLGEDKFDFVFCFGVLYHLKNPYKAMENLFKITNETLVRNTGH